MTFKFVMIDNDIFVYETGIHKGCENPRILEMFGRDSDICRRYEYYLHDIVGLDSSPSGYEFYLITDKYYIIGEDNV